MVWSRWIALALVLAAWTMASAGAATIRHDSRHAAHYRIGETFPSVGRVTVPGARASGVLIAPDWVLTAGHVVDDVDALALVYFGKHVYQASAWVTHPGWDGGLLKGRDLALIHLAEPVKDVAPSELHRGGDPRGAWSLSVGYGLTGNGRNGFHKSSLGALGITNYIDQLGANGLLMSDFDDPGRGGVGGLGSSVATAREGSIAPGDSGGGVFIRVDGERRLAGIHSFVWPRDGKFDSDYGDWYGSTSVSRHADWIDRVLASDPSSLGPGGSSVSTGLGEFRLAATSLSTVPEPGTAVGLAVTLGLWTRRLRRRCR
ncbi:MAG: trypsin-like serine protease [Planctomycetota bacterium]